MLLLGLTGSIATGKSTVSKLLRSPPYNLPIIDADVLARKVVEPGTSGYAAIVREFSATTPDLLLPASDEQCGGKEDGKVGKGRPLNRPALGRAVFGSGEEVERRRRVLNGIVHPAVRREMWKAVIRYFVRGYWAVVLDIPLLFDGPLHLFCGTSLVVAVTDPEVQIQRLRARDAHLTDEDARNRVISQGDVREKAARALARGKGRGEVVWNDGDQKQLKQAVDEIMGQIRAQSPWWWTWMCLVCPPMGVASASWALYRNWTLDKQWRERQIEDKARL